MIESTVLLLSDVVDSTQLAERLDMQQLAALWEAHDRAARSLLRDWGGREIDKSDGFLLLFDRVDQALGFAEAYHHALTQLAPPLKARVGIHIGPVVLRHNAADEVARGAKLMEVEGPAKPLAARVMSLALGGQTLLSETARSALGETTQRVQSHGHWRLKGLQAPIELFEVGGANAPFTPPPDAAKAYRVLRQGELWLPVRELRHTLPAERDSFVGRDPALQALAQSFEGGARLVSLLGIGGTGKTRLAQRFGWTWLGDFPGGVWFCDLSQATGLDGIVHAVAQGLELPLGKADPVQQIGQAIAGRGACLVIVDNFEQVARHAEATVGQWLDRAAEARFLVTTREVLGIVGEHAMPLAPLPVNDSVTLFMRRAVAAARSFAPVGDEAAAIEPLVKLLDGLPLAIELCAARARVMQPRALLQRMSERFKLLTSSGGRHDRQATLRATLDWSWDLLTEPERSALAQLSVFEGGFTLEAAEAVIDLSSFEDAPWVVDVVQSLLQKSLVRQVSDRRFELLRSVQDYAADCLSKAERAGDGMAPALQHSARRHWRYFAALDELAVVAEGCVETDNLVAACRRAAQQDDVQYAVGALTGSWAALRLSGPFSVAVALAADVQRLDGLGPVQFAEACWVAGSALYTAGKVQEARVQLEAGLNHVGGSARVEGLLLCALGELQSTAGEVRDARISLDRALIRSRDADPGRANLQCKVLNALGALSSDLSLPDEAAQHYSTALALARQSGDRRWEGGLLGNLGGLLHGSGRRSEARQFYEQSLVLIREVGDRRWEGNTRCNLGLLHHEEGRSAEARLQFDLALAMARAMGHARLECTVLCNLGILSEAMKSLPEARDHYQAAVDVAARLGDMRSEGEYRGYLGQVLASLHDSENAYKCFAVGRSLLLASEDQVSLARLICKELAAAERLGGETAAQAKRAELQTFLTALPIEWTAELSSLLQQAGVDPVEIVNPD